MNLVTWNCNMAFRKKAQYIIDEHIDIAVIQECENKERLASAFEHIEHNDIIWYGKNQHKGLAVISFNDYKIRLHEQFNPKFEYILPIILSNEEKQLPLFAIWAMDNKENKAKSYIGQVWDALQFYENIITQNVILIGDFNSNKMWDKMRKKGNHTDVVNFLRDKKIVSLYHHLNNIDHGNEKDPTLFLLKNKAKQYHMDYCFSSINMISEKTNIRVGKHNEWIRKSDHMPIWINELDW